MTFTFKDIYRDLFGVIDYDALLKSIAEFHARNCPPTVTMGGLRPPPELRLYFGNGPRHRKRPPGAAVLRLVGKDAPGGE